MDNKKKEELLYLKEVLKIIGLKVSKIIPGESPDFRLILGKKTIGAEVTEYYIDAGQKKGSNSRAVENYDKCVMEIVNEKVQENSNLKGITGSLSFKNQDRPKKAELETFSDELIGCAIESISKNKNFKETMDLVLTDAYPMLKKYLLFFTLEKCEFTSLWFLTSVGGISFTEENLINVIKPKIDKATKYKKSGIDELWLLIVCGVLPSQAVTPSWDVDNKLKNFNNLDNILEISSFDKIFLYLRSRGNTVYEWPGWIKGERKTQ